MKRANGHIKAHFGQTLGFLKRCPEPSGQALPPYIRKISAEICKCGGSDLTFGTSLWMYFVPQKYENDRWMSRREYEKKVVARGKEATSPPPVPVEPLPCLASGPPGQSLHLLLSFWFLSCLLVNKGDSSISDIVNQLCPCLSDL